MDPLQEKSKSTFERYRNAVCQLLRMIRDAHGHGKSSCVLLRKQYQKCEEGGDKNATHSPFCTHKGRLFKHVVEKEVFNSVRSAITASKEQIPSGMCGKEYALARYHEGVGRHTSGARMATCGATGVGGCGRRALVCYAGGGRGTLLVARSAGSRTGLRGKLV